MESLLAIMYSVSLRQSKAEDRLTLAIPASDLLSYYGSRLLADAITVSEGLLLTLNIPLASQQTVFTFMKQNFFQCLFRTILRRLLHGTSKLQILLFLKTNLNRLSYLRNNLSTVLVRRSTEFAPKPSQRR